MLRTALRTAHRLLAVAALAGGCTKSLPPPNIVVITLDTTRADHLSCYGYPALLTPHLDELARHSVVFDRAYAPMSQTLPSHCTLFTGRDPREHGALENFYLLSADQLTLAEWLSDRGYKTGGFVGANVLSEDTGLGQGFQTFDEPNGDVAAWRRGAEVTDAVLAWADTLAGASQPFLLWAHYFDAHEPETTQDEPGVPEATVRKLVEGNASIQAPSMDKTVGLWHAYSNGVAYEDEQVGRMLDGLRARGLLQRTVILVVGDHGEGLGEHGAWGHGWHIHEPMVRVPLMLSLPDGELAGTRVPGAVVMRDALPTLLAAAGLPAPAEASGLDLLTILRSGRPLPDRPTFVERPHLSQKRLEFRAGGKPQYDAGFFGAVIVGGEKLVRYPDGTETLYDLSTDPLELHDLAAAAPDRRARLSGMLTVWNEQDKFVDRAGEDQASDARHRALRQLGY